MELDELKQKWQEHDRRLNAVLRLNRDLLFRPARFALWRLAALLGGGALLLLAVIGWLGRFIAENIAHPRFFLPAMLLDVFAIAALVTHFIQIALALRANYGEPVADLQKYLEHIRQIRVRCVQVAFVVAVPLWLPMFIVGMKGLFGADIYRYADRAWLIWNAVFGFAMIPAAIWLVRRYSNAVTRSATGYNLAAATEFLRKLSEFQTET